MMHSNELTINVRKSTLIFCNMNRIQKRDLDIHLGEEKLEIKEFVKCVGIYIDSELTRGKHTQSISFRLQKGIGITREM